MSWNCPECPEKWQQLQESLLVDAHFVSLIWGVWARRYLETQELIFCLSFPETRLPVISSSGFILSFTSPLCLTTAGGKSSFENRNVWNKMPTTTSSYLNWPHQQVSPYLQHDKYHSLCNYLSLYWKILLILFYF